MSRILVTRQEAARLLGVSVSTFKRHVEPHVRYVQAGARPMFLVRELEEWAEGRAVAPPAADWHRIGVRT